MKHWDGMRRRGQPPVGLENKAMTRILPRHLARARITPDARKQVPPVATSRAQGADLRPTQGKLEFRAFAREDRYGTARQGTRQERYAVIGQGDAAALCRWVASKLRLVEQLTVGDLEMRVRCKWERGQVRARDDPVARRGRYTIRLDAQDF